MKFAKLLTLMLLIINNGYMSFKRGQKYETNIFREWWWTVSQP